MQTIRSALETTVASYPEHVAVQLGTGRVSYSELFQYVVNVALKLQHHGVTPSVPVALVFQNVPSCIIAFLALGWMECSVIPLEPEISVSTLKSILGEIEFNAVLSSHQSTRRFAAFCSEHAVSLIDTDNLLKESSGSFNDSLDSPVSRNTFLYHYTSGSTGKPKAALHSQQNLINGAIIYKSTYELQPDDTILVTVPLAHSFGMVAGLLASLISGARLMLIERFAPRVILETIAREDVTYLVGVPFVYDLLARTELDQPLDLGALRICLSSGAPLLASVATKFLQRYGKSIYQVYGTTETGVIAAQWPRAEGWPEGAIGRPLTGVFVRVVDEGGKEVAPNIPGSLLVKTPAMFNGYYMHPEATEKAFFEGWYVTGDIASQDDEDHLYLSGRKETFINVGGKKVNPLDVENVLLSHPSVKEVIVFGTEAESAGQQVVASVVLNEPVSSNELIQFCRDRLPFYQVPGQIQFVSTLSKTSMGKPRRVS